MCVCLGTRESNVVFCSAGRVADADSLWHTRYMTVQQRSLWTEPRRHLIYENGGVCAGMDPVYRARYSKKNATQMAIEAGRSLVERCSRNMWKYCCGSGGRILVKTDDCSVCIHCVTLHCVFGASISEVRMAWTCVCKPPSAWNRMPWTRISKFPLRQSRRLTRTSPRWMVSPSAPSIAGRLGWFKASGTFMFDWFA